jgi:hypothetical protein
MNKHPTETAEENPRPLSSEELGLESYIRCNAYLRRVFAIRRAYERNLVLHVHWRTYKKMLIRSGRPFTARPWGEYTDHPPWHDIGGYVREWIRKPHGIRATMGGPPKSKILLSVDDVQKSALRRNEQDAETWYEHRNALVDQSQQTKVRNFISRRK